MPPTPGATAWGAPAPFDELDGAAVVVVAPDAVVVPVVVVEVTEPDELLETPALVPVLEGACKTNEPF